MKKSKRSDSEKVKAVKALECGATAEVLCREFGISRSKLYQWRSKYGGMEVSQVRRLRELEEENRKLKQMYADLALDNRILRDVIEKTIEPEVKKELVCGMVDEYDVAISIPAARLIRILEKVIWTMGKPKNIRCDNGPEFIAGIFQEWCKSNDINLMYIQPGHPTQNSYIERFNGSYRRAVLDAYLFRTLDDVRKITDEWSRDYNENRPHDSLGDCPQENTNCIILKIFSTFASPI